MTTRYWVYDKDDSKTGFPLETLLRLVLAFFDFKILQVLVHRAEGYGEKLLSWDQLLFNPEDQVTSSLEELLEVLRDDEEIIYWLDVEFCLSNGSSFRFGLHDSSFMYVETVANLRELLTSTFEKIKVDLTNN